MDNEVKVHFQLQQDEDEWPPTSVESVWAQPGTCENEYIIDNVPFFTREATIGDVVQIRKKEGNLWFEKKVKSSTNSLIRIIVFDLEMIEEISKRLISMGCDTELFRNFKMIAVNIPASVKLSAVQDHLQAQARTGRLDFEEAILRQ